MYEVYLESAAERDLQRVPAGHFARVIRAIKSLVRNPRPAACRKISGSQNDWRLHVGDYRVPYEIDDKAAIVPVMRVRHRRHAYGG